MGRVSLQSMSGFRRKFEDCLGFKQTLRGYHKDTSVACQVLEHVAIYFHSESLEPQMCWCELELSTQAASWPHRTQSEIKVEMGVNSFPGSLLCWPPRVVLPDLRIWVMRIWKSKYIAGKPEVIIRDGRQELLYTEQPQDGSVPFICICCSFQHL